MNSPADCVIKLNPFEIEDVGEKRKEEVGSLVRFYFMVSNESCNLCGMICVMIILI